MAETNICQYYPPWFRRILDFQALCQTERVDLRTMEDAMERIHQNFFIQTMDENTTSQWEGILRSLPVPGETLDFRRLRVLNRLSLRPPFTMIFLRQKLDSLFGQENYDAAIDFPNYALLIEIFAENPGVFDNIGVLRDIINIIKPCHIIYNSALTFPEMKKSLYVTPYLGRAIGITHLPELIRPDAQRTEDELI